MTGTAHGRKPRLDCQFCAKVLASSEARWRHERRAREQGQCPKMGRRKTAFKEGHIRVECAHSGTDIEALGMMGDLLVMHCKKCDCYWSEDKRSLKYVA